MFWVSVGSRDWLPSGEQLVLRRRTVAGLDEESSVVFCGHDVRDALAVKMEEPVDNPGTTIGIVFSVLHWLSVNFDKKWFLTTGPLKRQSVIFAEFHH